MVVKRAERLLVNEGPLVCTTCDWQTHDSVFAAPLHHAMAQPARSEEELIPVPDRFRRDK